MDDNFHSYLNRVAKLTLPDTYASQISNLQESPKFELQGQKRVPASFPGYSIITPPAEADLANKDFYASLTECQQQLAKNVAPDLIALVDPASFHLTVADLVWDNSYLSLRDGDPGFEPKLRQQIAEGFQSYQPPSQEPVSWQIMGVMLRPRAIAVSLVPVDEAGYDRITAFRRSVYQNPASWVWVWNSNTISPPTLPLLTSGTCSRSSIELVSRTCCRTSICSGLIGPNLCRFPK